jgi:hypothetical protein
VGDGERAAVVVAQRPHERSDVAALPVAVAERDLAAGAIGAEVNGPARTALAVDDEVLADPAPGASADVS